MSLAFIDGAEHQLPTPPLFDDMSTYSPVYTNNGRYSGWTYRTAGVPIIWEVPSGVADPEVWVGSAQYHQASLTGSNQSIITLYGDGATATHMTVYVGSSGQLSVYRGTSAGTLLGTSANGVISAATWAYVELYGLIDDTVGAFELRVDGASVLSGSGIDTRNGGTSPNVTAVSVNRSNASANFSYLDDIYCVTGDGVGASGFQGEITIEGIKPNGNGNYSQLVGQDGDSTNNYLNVDELPFSSTDYNGSSTAGDKDTYAYGDLTATTGNILGTVLHFAAFKTLAGFIKGRRLIRLSATDYAGSDTPSLSATTRYFSEVFENSPDTSTAWTISEVNGIEAGFEVRSA